MQAWFSHIESLAPKMFDLAVHLMKLNVKNYAIEKENDLNDLIEEETFKFTKDSTGSIKLESKVSVISRGNIPEITYPGEDHEGHGSEFDKHDFAEAIFKNGRKIKILPPYTSLLEFLRHQEGEFHVQDFPTIDSFVKISFARLLADNGVVRLH